MLLILLRNRDFRLLWIGQLLSNVGTWLLVVAVPYRAFELTGSPAAAGEAYIAQTLPALLAGPLAGVFVDRFDNRRLMAAVDVVRALAVSAMLLVHGAGAVWVLYAAVFTENAAGQFFRPARQAVLPALVGRDDDLAAANAMYSVIDGVVRLVGAALGGVLYAVLGFAGLVLLDAASYLVSAVSCLFLSDRAARVATAAPDRPGMLADLREGVAFLWRAPGLSTLLAISAGFYLLNGGVSALLVPFVRQVLHGGSTEFGFLLSSLGAGYLVGAPVARLLQPRLRAGSALALGLAVLGACLLVAFHGHRYWIALVSVGLAGVPGVLILVTVQTGYQRATNDHLLGRVGSAFFVVEMVASVSGAAVASVAASQMSLARVLDVVAGGLLILALAPWLLLGANPVMTAINRRWRLRETDSMRAVDQ